MGACAVQATAAQPRGRTVRVFGCSLWLSTPQGVHFGALERKGREQRVRYGLRPAIGNERPGLTAILAPPRFPLWRYHGVLAPDAPWRKHIVSATSEPDDDGCSHKASTNSLEPAREGKRTGGLDKPRDPSGDTSLPRSSPEPVAPSAGKPSWRPSTPYVP